MCTPADTAEPRVHANSEPTRHAWNTTPPPQDGTTIVAVGRVIYSDEFSTTSQPFVAAVVWEKDASGFEGWHTLDGMSVARALDDEVKIDFWLPFPKEAA